MESRHAKNITNFETVTNILDGLVTVYDPSQTLSFFLLLAALRDRLEEASAVLDEIDAALVDKTTRIDEIQAELKDLDRYVGGIKRTAESELGDEALTRDLQNIVDQLNSQSRSMHLDGDEALTPDTEEARTKFSASRQNRDDQIARLAAALALLKNRNDYDPPDPRYKIPVIEARLAALTEKNEAAKAAEAALASALAARDRLLYDDDTGIIKLVKLIKAELARKPGKDSAAYQQINALEFRKY
jgi:chromosome segregation ATPase